MPYLGGSVAGMLAGWIVDGMLEPLTDLDTLDDLRAEWPRLLPMLEPHPELARAVTAALRAARVSASS